jgi:dipeptidyl aminopeptidase/acylaminoacyl peptidase
VTPAGATFGVVEWSRDGRYVAAVWHDPDSPSSARVFLIEAATGQRRELAAGPFWDLAWSGDGHYLAVTSAEGTDAGIWGHPTPTAVSILEVDSGRTLATIKGATAMAWLDKTGKVSSWW